MNTETKTPRTDAELFLSRGMGIVPTLPKQSVPANLARTLERELAAVTKERDEAASRILKLEEQVREWESAADNGSGCDTPEGLRNFINCCNC